VSHRHPPWALRLRVSDPARGGSIRWGGWLDQVHSKVCNVLMGSEGGGGGGGGGFEEAPESPRYVYDDGSGRWVAEHWRLTCPGRVRLCGCVPPGVWGVARRPSHLTITLCCWQKRSLG